MTTLSRQQLRHQLKSARSQLSFAYRQACAQAVCRQFCQQPFYQPAATIACYFAQHAELDLSPLINQIIADSKKCYLPILTKKNLLFGEFQADTKLMANNYGILEPVTRLILMPAQLDLICVPLVGFDRCGNRLGMGGGFYDRSFAFKINNAAVNPLLIGLAYSIQEITALPRESWDVPLDIIITEKEIIRP